MYSSFFYKLSWNAQFAAGIVLFVLSFLIEAYVLAQYLGDKSMALALAGALEASKALSTVFYRFLRMQTLVHYPGTVASLLGCFRLSLIVLSIACSAMYLAGSLDRPYLEPVRAADLKQAEEHFTARTARVEADYQERRTRAEEEIRLRYQHLEQRTQEHYVPTIQALEKQLVQEMSNVVGGIFEGARYREIRRRLEEAKAEYQQQVAAVDQAWQAEVGAARSALAEPYQQALQNLINEREASLNAIRQADYHGDGRVENPLLHSFLSVYNGVFNTQLSSLQFVFFFSVFLSLVIEIGIIVIFEHITLSYMPLFQAEHRRSLGLHQKRIEAEGKLQEAGVDDTVIRERIDKDRQRIEQRMREAVTRLSV